MTSQAKTAELTNQTTESPFQKLTAVLSKLDFKSAVYPMIGIVVFLILWSFTANKIDTSLGKFPGPTQVYQAGLGIIDEYNAEKEKEAAFYVRQDERHAKKLAKDPDATLKFRKYTGKETFLAQIITSLKTCLLYTSPSPRDA